MNKTTAIIVIVIVAVLGWVLFMKKTPAPAPVVENVEEQEENQQTPVTPTPTAPAVNLNGTSYRLTYYNGMAISKSENYTLSFTDGRLSAKFCNNMSGNYTVSGNMLKAPNLVSTLMLCTLPKYLQEMETLLITSLSGQGASVSLVGGILVLGDGQNTLTFAAVTE